VSESEVGCRRLIIKDLLDIESFAISHRFRVRDLISSPTVSYPEFAHAVPEGAGI
jgi:hypothetical protein